jgi:hypothetical protein
MKMLFYSSDNSEVDRVSKEFLNAGIPCEVRKGPALRGKTARPPQAELWIRNDRDCHRAFMLCVHLGVGFAKRAPRKLMFDGSELEAEFEAEPDAEDDAAGKPELGPIPRLRFAKRASC